MSKKTSRRVSVPLDCLVRLWNSRADTLDNCEAVVVNNKPLKDQLSAMASSYRQCACELEKPPMALFKELGIQPNERAVRIDGPPRDGDTHEPVVGRPEDA